MKVLELDNFSIEREVKLADDTVEMVLEVDAYTRTLYPAECCYGLQPRQLEDPQIHFFVIRENGYPVACGGIKIFDDNADDCFTEVKRMYVRSQNRGKGLARFLLQHLETLSKELGFHIMRLETGVKQPDAIALYEKMGFSRCPTYGDYATNDVNLYYEKHI